MGPQLLPLLSGAPAGRSNILRVHDVRAMRWLRETVNPRTTRHQVLNDSRAMARYPWRCFTWNDRWPAILGASSTCLQGFHVKHLHARRARMDWAERCTGVHAFPFRFPAARGTDRPSPLAGPHPPARKGSMRRTGGTDPRWIGTDNQREPDRLDVSRGTTGGTRRGSGCEILDRTTGRGLAGDDSAQA